MLTRIELLSPSWGRQLVQQLISVHAYAIDNDPGQIRRQIHVIVKAVSMEKHPYYSNCFVHY